MKEDNKLTAPTTSKSTLAHFLKEFIPEYQDLSIDEIIPLIQDDAFIIARYPDGKVEVNELRFNKDNMS